MSKLTLDDLRRLKKIPKRTDMPTIEVPSFPLPAAVTDVIAEAKEKLAHRPKLLQMFENCFPNTLQTATKRMDDGTTFVLTGDIPAMWLRDAVEQVAHYVPIAKGDKELEEIISGLIKRMAFYINLDPYANAFNESANDWHWRADDQTDMSPWVWERKYEVDSLCFPMKLAYEYWKETGVTDFFDDQFLTAMARIVDVWKTEQRHMEKSPYRFTRTECRYIDTLHNEGMGMPVNYTGMTWGGFNPSDDVCKFHYHVPSNMFAVVVLGYIAEMALEIYDNVDLARRALRLEEEIDQGIKTYGTVIHPEFGQIYAFEVDGFGNYNLMDDTGAPSLMSIPYIGYAKNDDPIYQNTRRFILSKHNPYYFEGTFAKGIGSSHTPYGYVWHLSLSMQGLTSSDPQEIREIIDMIEATDADTGFAHEGFDPNNPHIYTREWFAWSNSWFAALIYKAMQHNIAL
ncbi:glycoside hydrolase family 125 protein [Paenibacillus yanchengensis]|uniref:Glycoside hydrolase family 125 protein n=1 Tax=Paenibacillus yanchengensis TaxID=2035833 RepID=A0ABW4YFS3_9BACL